MPDLHNPSTHSYNRLSCILVMPVVFILFFPTTGYTQEPRIVHYSLSECDHKQSLKIVREGILRLESRFDTLHLEVSQIFNCCHGDSTAISLRNDTLTLLTYTPWTPKLNENGDTIGWREPMQCDCNCCFTLSYLIKGIPDTNIVVMRLGKVLQRISDKLVPFYTITNNNDTLWSHDPEGFEYFYTTLPSGKLALAEKKRWDQSLRRTYNEQGQLTRERIWNGIDKKLPLFIYRDFLYNEQGELIHVEEKIVERE